MSATFVAHRALVVRASSAGDKKKLNFGGEFKKRLSIDKKKLDALSSKLADVHKKNLEKLDIIAKDDVEFVKELFEKDDEELHVEFVDVEVVDEE
jgi:hypothetical protein